MKSLKFNKFFPEDNAFITVSGRYDDFDDWQVNVTLQSDTRSVADWWISDWNKKDAITQLKAIQEAAQKAIDFATMCATQPLNAAKTNAEKRAKKK